MRSSAPQVQGFWKLAERVAPSVFQDRVGPKIEGDQMPLIEAGIPSVLLISSEYPSIKRGENASRGCSPQGLEAIGEALLRYVTTPGQFSANLTAN